MSRFNKKPSVMTDADYREFAGLRARDFAEADRAQRIKDMGITYRGNEYENRKYGPPMPKPQPSRQPMRWTVPKEEIAPRSGGRIPKDLIGPSIKLSGKGLAAFGLRGLSPLIDIASTVGPYVDGSAYNDPFGSYVTGRADKPAKSVACPPFLFPPNYDGSHGVWMGIFSGDVTSATCLTGQAWPDRLLIRTGSGQLTGNTTVRGWAPRTFFIGPANNNNRHRNSTAHFYAENTWGVNQTIGALIRPTQYQPARLSIPNPNLQRLAQPNLSLEHAPAITIGLAPAPRPEPQRQALTITGGGRNGQPPRKGIAVRRPYGSRPPGEGTSEKKTKNYGPALFAFLDAISEAGDVIDAIYEALPDKTKKRNPCDRSVFLIDKGGQYGIGNADCKLAALARNWHKLDPALALRYVIANQIEDKVVGEMMKRLPRNIGQVADPGIQALVEGLDNLFKAGGLVPK